MTAKKAELVQSIWRGHDPFETFDWQSVKPDLQGWNSNHHYLIEAVSELKPQVIVEIGVWKGGSVITMAETLKTLGLDGVVVAVDTWLGSWEHWLCARGDYGFDNHDDLGFDRGQQRLYQKFMANVAAADVADYVVPLPLDSNNASHVMKRLGKICGIVHIDAGHDYHAVMKDLQSWWDVIPPGGALICDDYSTDGITWPDVRKAVDEFVATVAIASFEQTGGKALIKKAH